MIQPSLRSSTASALDGEALFDSGVTQESCPDCGKPKVWKHGKWDSKFLGCSSYPKCKWASYKDKSKAALGLSVKGVVSGVGANGTAFPIGGKA